MKDRHTGVARAVGEKRGTGRGLLYGLALWLRSFSADNGHET